MTTKDPDKAALRKRLADMDVVLASLREYVMRQLAVTSLPSLHAVIGGKNAWFLDIKNEVIKTPESFFALWTRGLQRHVARSARYSRLAELLCDDPKVYRYVRTFLARTYLRNSHALSKPRPTVEQAEVWLGPNNADYGLLVVPRISSHGWENDKSEIRHFPHPYFTIRHVLSTGLVVPDTEDIIEFASFKDYLRFFRRTLVRLANSPHQDTIAYLYCKYVEDSAEPELVPLLLPEVRYSREEKHRYRLDFMIVNPDTLERIGFELSPWSTHGRLTGTKGMTQAQINAKARANREAEQEKCKAYFREHEIFVLVYTDEDLAKPERIFADIKRSLETKHAPSHLEDHALAELRRSLRRS